MYKNHIEHITKENIFFFKYITDSSPPSYFCNDFIFLLLKQSTHILIQFIFSPIKDYVIIMINFSNQSLKI